MDAILCPACGKIVNAGGHPKRYHCCGLDIYANEDQEGGENAVPLANAPTPMD